jgi:hypothetical protein
MDANHTYPYSLELCETPGRHYQWAIRERGRVIQRADRLYPSERVAREKGNEELEKVFGFAIREAKRNQRRG